VFSYNNFVHAVAGSLASVSAMSATYPLDKIRARIQLDDLSSKSGTLQTLVRLLKEEGLNEVYRGIIPTLESLCCSNFIYFYVFHGLKGDKKRSAFQNLLFGAVAGAVNVIVTTPLWVVNTRIKLGAQYNSLCDGLLQISQKEGPKTLWASVGPSLLLVLNPALVFMIYESMKRVNGGALNHLLIGSIAKCIATVVTYPLQIVQTKMRNGCSTKSSFSLLSQMIRRDGIRSIFKGMESKIIQTVTTAALMFLFYEKIVNFVFYLMKLKIKSRK